MENRDPATRRQCNALQFEDFERRAAVCLDEVHRHVHESQGLSILLGITEPADAERVFHALAENGMVTMPMAQTFWAVRFGALVDQFGIPWAINCEQAPD